MSDRRFSVYRANLLAAAPAYLGEVLAPDDATAAIRGAKAYGGAVVVHAAVGKPNTALLERALRTIERKGRRPVGRNQRPHTPWRNGS